MVFYRPKNIRLKNERFYPSLFRDVIQSYNKRAVAISRKNFFEEMIAIKLRLQALKNSLRAPGKSPNILIIADLR